jgi:hypothetical protein
VDTLQALRINASDVSSLFASINNAIVFRCPEQAPPLWQAVTAALRPSACQADELCAREV